MPFAPLRCLASSTASGLLPFAISRRDERASSPRTTATSVTIPPVLLLTPTLLFPLSSSSSLLHFSFLLLSTPYFLRLSLRFTFFSAASKAFFGSPWTLNEVEMNAVKCTKKQSQTVAFDAEEGQCAYFYSKINDKRCFLVFEAIGTFYYFHYVLLLNT